MSTPAVLSVLDLAPRRPDDAPSQAFTDAVALARTAEDAGYRGVWYAEHHNMPTIASSATAVLMAHVGAHTSSIRLGAGGVMLPNHAPLVIAEQFGTLAAMYPDRIDLGLGRAPGTDPMTLRALRRTPDSAEHFPQDVTELLGYLDDDTNLPGVNAYPGRGSRVPVTILGSSLFGAHLAAQLGLGYAFASHFAPDALEAATTTYLREFRPSERLAEPHLAIGVGVSAAEDEALARARFDQVGRERVRSMLGRRVTSPAGALSGGGQRELTEDELDLLIDTPAGQQVLGSLRFSAVGTPDAVASQLAQTAADLGAAELITVHHAPDAAGRQESVRLLGTAWGR